MSITIDGKSYPVPDGSKQFRVTVEGTYTYPERRNKPGGVWESDEAMQQRVQKKVAALQVRQSSAATCVTRAVYVTCACVSLSILTLCSLRSRITGAGSCST